MTEVTLHSKVFRNPITLQAEQIDLGKLVPMPLYRTSNGNYWEVQEGGKVPVTLIGTRIYSLSTARCAPWTRYVLESPDEVRRIVNQALEAA